MNFPDISSIDQQIINRHGAAGAGRAHQCASKKWGFAGPATGPGASKQTRQTRGCLGGGGEVTEMLLGRVF